MAEYPACGTGNAMNESEPVVLFDEACSMCSRGVRWIKARDADERFTLAGQESEFGEQMLKARPERLKQQDSIFLLDQRGRWHSRSGAITRILLGLPRAWPVLGALLWLVPFPLRDLGYIVVARHRHRRH